jgi:hypothetical protein
MSENTTNSSVDAQLQTLLILNIISLVLSAVTTAITSMRCRSRCPCCDCNMRPSTALPTPPSAVDPESPSGSSKRKEAEMLITVDDS